MPNTDIALVGRGDAILNNDHFVMNAIGVIGGGIQAGGIGAGANLLSPGQTGFRRYGFTGLVVENYIDVTTPGATEEGFLTPGGQQPVNLPTIVVNHLPSATFTVDGASVTHYGGSQSVNITPGQVVNGVQVIAGRLYVPLRSIVVEGLGGEVSWIPGPAGGSEGSAVTGTLNGRTAIFPVGSLTFYDYLGRTIPAPYGMAAFIGNGTVGVAGRTYVPLRSIALAFGLELDGMGAGGTAAVLN